MISVDEDDGVVLVCAEVISGELERSVLFSLTSADGTAIGQFIREMTICLIVCSHVQCAICM